jgi:hypothetical protein
MARIWWGKAGKYYGIWSFYWYNRKVGSGDEIKRKT